MKKTLIELLQEKNDIYETIIYKIKEKNFNLLIPFESEFKKIDEINEKLDYDNMSRILNIRL